MTQTQHQLRIGKRENGRWFTLPIDYVTQTGAGLAKRGVGKSTTAAVISEELLKAAQQVIIIDPTDTWWGLRSSADGKGDGLPIYILGGQRADLPLNEHSGKLIAEFLVRERVPAVISMGDLVSKGAERRFVTDFCERFYQLKNKPENRTPVHLMIDEADEFFPQKIPKGHERMVGAIDRIIRRGRAFGIGVTLISQRSAVVNKDGLTQTELLIAMRTTSPQDRAAIKAWIEAKDSDGQGETMMASLTSLKVGEAWFWSPGWLGCFEKIKVRQRETFDSAATPKVGQTIVPPDRMAEVDLGELQTAMAEAVEEAKANDPKELKARIRELEAEIRGIRAENRDGDAVERAVEAALAKAADEWGVKEKGLREALEEQGKRLESIQRIANSGLPFEVIPIPAETPKPSDWSRTVAVKGEGPVAAIHATYTREPDKPRPPSKPQTSPASGGRVSGPQQKIIDAIAWFCSVGIVHPSRSSVAAVAGVSPRSSGFEKNVSTLRSQLGAIDYPGSGLLSLTIEGEALANHPHRPPSLRELHEAWMDSPAISGPQARILERLIACYPDSVTRNELAESVDVSVKSSGFEKNVSRLSSLGLVVYPEPGEVRANSELLFPKGLR